MLLIYTAWSLGMPLSHNYYYCMAGNIGGELNLAVHAKTAKIKFAASPPMSRSRRIVSSNRDDGAVKVLERKGVHMRL